MYIYILVFAVHVHCMCTLHTYMHVHVDYIHVYVHVYVHVHDVHYKQARTNPLRVSIQTLRYIGPFEGPVLLLLQH